MSNADPIKELEDINRKIGTAEKTKKPELVSDILSDDLIFRRANGLITLKGQFLADLVKLGDSTERLDAEGIEISVYETTAVVSLVVHMKGIRDNKPAEGSFRNIRVFERTPEGWKLQMWFNKKIG